MKLGIAYNTFDGHELLEFALKAIRSEVDFVSVVYQNTSYFGKSADLWLLPNLERLKSIGLVDRLILSEPLPITPMENEVNNRNLGLAASAEAGCSHHISADVDEMYLPEQLAFAKSQMDKFDCSAASLVNYYKYPTHQIVDEKTWWVSLIQRIDNDFVLNGTFPFLVDQTRRPRFTERCRVFLPHELLIHHYSFVRKDIRQKFLSSRNATLGGVNRMLADFERYRLGQTVRLPPDFIYKPTIQVENIFNIQL